ncbi:TPA: hypothetical protein ACN6Z4_005104, partial [Escherichia albertii]
MNISRMGWKHYVTSGTGTINISEDRETLYMSASAGLTTLATTEIVADAESEIEVTFEARYIANSITGTDYAICGIYYFGFQNENGGGLGNSFSELRITSNELQTYTAKLIVPATKNELNSNRIEIRFNIPNNADGSLYVIGYPRVSIKRSAIGVSRIIAKGIIDLVQNSGSDEVVVKLISCNNVSNVTMTSSNQNVEINLESFPRIYPETPMFTATMIPQGDEVPGMYQPLYLTFDAKSKKLTMAFKNASGSRIAIYQARHLR